VILGNMDVLIDDLGPAAEKVQTEIDLIIEQVYRIRSITDRLLQYSRAEVTAAALPGRSRIASEQATADLPPVCLAQTVAESLRLLVHELDGRHISLTERHQAAQSALINRQELQQVLVNLLSNAIDAIGEHGRIWLETDDVSTGSVSITVRDSGCGIDPQDLPRVFDPFFTSGKARGTGLGLSVSYGIVRRFGGDIQVRSEPGAGSVFEVILPGVRSATHGARTDFVPPA